MVSNGQAQYVLLTGFVQKTRERAGAGVSRTEWPWDRRVGWTLQPSQLGLNPCRLRHLSGP